MRIFIAALAVIFWGVYLWAGIVVTHMTVQELKRSGTGDPVWGQWVSCVVLGVLWTAFMGLAVWQILT